jgi:hypothetical protein
LKALKLEVKDFRVVQRRDAYRGAHRLVYNGDFRVAIADILLCMIRFIYSSRFDGIVAVWATALALRPV